LRAMSPDIVLEVPLARLFPHLREGALERKPGDCMGSQKGRQGHPLRIQLWNTFLYIVC